ncbi:MAG: hypothetical protein LKJ25_02180 [Clostridia bacterium]|nr:hypothetical protein [Clostridia bacterium]
MENSNLIRKRDFNLSEYNISLYEYRELEYFCLQYREKKQRLGQISLTNIEHYKGEKVNLENDLKMIDLAAYKADSYIYNAILKNVIDGISYEYLNVKCGRQQFYKLRRLFFFNLYKMRKHID